MTGDLVAWLRARIAEVRRIAELGPEEPWPADLDPFLHWVLQAPVTALAQCDAHEAILREHRPYGEWLRDELPDWAPSEERSCVGCGFDNQEERQTLDVNNCPTLRALALAYQHRDGYLEEWRQPPGE